MRIAQLAAEQWGVLSLDELRALGLTRDAVANRVRNGRLHPLHRGVYAVGHGKLPLEGVFLAALKACGAGAVLSHYSAAALWEFLRWDPRYPEVLILGDSRRVHPGVNVHRTRALDRRDVGWHRGIAVTSPARTLVDLAATFPYSPLRRTVRRAQAQYLVNPGQIMNVIERLGRRPGVSRLRRIVATGPAPTRSELEDVVLDLILRGGLVHPRVNVPLVLDGRRVIPDFRWPQQDLIVEADGAQWHGGEIARADDAERQALLEAHGQRVLRVTWRQAVLSPGQTLARLVSAGAPQVGRVVSLSASG
jgi:very-short-patch-repair endonuclease